MKEINKQSKAQLFVRASIFLIFLGMAGMGFYALFEKLPVKFKIPFVKTQRYLHDHKQLHILSHPELYTESERARALKKLMIYDNPQVLEFARQEVKSTVPELKSISLLGLARFAESSELAQYFLKQESLKPQIINALLRNPKAKDFYQQIEASPSITDDIKAQFVKSDTQVMPQNPKVLQYHRDLIEKNEGDLPFSVTHLARLKDPWLVTNVSRFLKQDSMNLKLAILPSLKYFCPPDITAQLIQGFLAADQFKLKRAYFKALMHYGLEKRGQQVAELLDDPKLREKEKAELKDLEQRFQNKDLMHCH